MKVKIKQFDTSLPLPAYKTAGAAATDLCARVTTTIEPKAVGYIPLNVALEVPDDYWVIVAARGSTHKQGLMPVHGIGIGDADFKGDNDEYHFPVYNFTDQPVVIEKGQRIAQMIVMPYERVEFEVVESLDSEDRGKFGSTGTH
jgi:dUTP pyrophosphatase